ncbi:MAG: hypothetical protein AMS23_09850 [Bacteroides sp. SM1_62]|nr:MAG: hypothetical protein AMS26_08900 [Bacteroides sp. SM23_62]KPL21092.1 MAG: hypothetical protein AMS23_09850 [Bacteroides sp. SM1_62]
MKSSHIHLCFCLLFLFTGFISPDLYAGSCYSIQAYQDSTEYQSFQGKVVDIQTGNPIIFASIFLSGTNIGTVSNSEGEFLIKIPMFLENKVIGISSIGYKNVEIPIGQLNPEGNLVELEPNPIPIEEVTIINQDARDLLEMALQSIPDNYSNDPVMMTSFYRETIKQNRNYVSVSEAVLDGYKASYTDLGDLDRVKIFKGRKSQDVKKMDTILFKLQGGPQTMFMLDIVKNPGELFEDDIMGYYIYQMGGIINIDDRQAFVVTFEQMEHLDIPLYAGKIYIGVNDYAFVGAEFKIHEKNLENASQYLIRKKPVGMRVEVDNANYLVNYRLIDGTWHLNYVRTELMFTVRWKKKLFRSRYTTMTEMAVTDIEARNITKYKFRETTKRSDIFADQVSNFEDPDFWGEYNIIQPEESIQSAIERIGRKLQRMTR